MLISHHAPEISTVVAVGIAAVDIINVTDEFPLEDSEVRALSQTVRRGGNATNTLCVLKQLGHNCQWAGSLADNYSSHIIEQDLAYYDIDTHRCRRIKGAHAPTSYITLNRSNGSRTIVHHRELDEFEYSDFIQHDFNQVDWLHFEGRHVEQTLKMMQYSREHYPELPISLEIEKPRPHIESLIAHADFVLFSSHYALARGHKSAAELLHQSQSHGGQYQICTWGSHGAYARSKDNSILHAHPVKIPRVVDSIGAGDTFNAGLIHAILVGKDLEQSLNFANSLAARKCAQQGFVNLRV